MLLSAIGHAEIQDYTSGKVDKGLSKKTVNNHLSVLRRLLVIAKKRKLIQTMPEMEWLKVPDMTMRYSHLSPAIRREAVKLLDAIPSCGDRAATERAV